MLTGRNNIGNMLVVLAACLVVCGATTPNPVPTATAPAPCERAPAHAQPADAHYRLSIAGDPDLFLPGELYTVSLQGVDSGEGPTPFIGFRIWVETSDVSKNDNDTLKPASNTSTISLGTFQAYDAQTKLEEHCTPAVDNATAHPKTEIQVIWSAPTNMVEACVRVCARAVSITGGEGGAGNAALVVAGGGKGPGTSVLARKICAAPAAPATATRQPPILEPCCACDEAKYEVTFEGLWSRNTHPREFPPESARAHFSDVIGASHTAQYRVWQEGRVASTGLRRLADDGTTTALEKELKAESDHIRTIIKARGISWQQVAGVGIPTTFAVFRVDAKNHLVSLAAKLAPSPDWIVGVSALELCNANCTWSTSATLPLYPYDAGTDGGIGYTSTRIPTVPAVPVRALRPDWPRDVRSPFYSTSGEMRPFARLRLTRLRLYEKSCDAVESVGPGQAHPEGISINPGTVGAGGVGAVVTGASGGGGVGGACSTRVWGAWGACSVTCGEGRASRQRTYVWPARAYAEACRVPLTDYRTCHGPRMHCRAPSPYEPDPAELTGPCAVSAWSAWSACEGCGLRARTRHYVAPRAHKRCHRGFRASTVLSQAMPCAAGPCVRPPGVLANSTNYDWFFVDFPRGECPVTSWGGWSPCSSRCGRGRRLRTRLYLAPRNTASVTDDVQRVLTKRLLHRWNSRFAHLQLLEVPPENITDEDPAVESLVQEHLERCQFTLTQQEALCDGDEGNCLNASISPDTCKLPLSVGHCRGYEERWFHDAARATCEPFGFSGCGGNANNFRAREHCLQACGNQKSIVATTVPTETSSKKLKPTPPHQDNEVLQNDAPRKQSEDVDCEVGPWLGWSDCLGDCDFAVKLNYRLVLRGTSGAGKPCRKLVKSRPCKPAHCLVAVSVHKRDDE